VRYAGEDQPDGSQQFWVLLQVHMSWNTLKIIPAQVLIFIF